MNLRAGLRKKGCTVLIAGLFICLLSLGAVSPADAGWYTINADNQASVAWSDFHLEIFEIEGHSGDALFDISNVVFDITNPFEPSSSQGLDVGNEWSVSPDGKKINFNFYGDTFAAGATDGWWKVHISNPDQVLHGVSFYPTVVPEPVSSTLFIIGGVALGVRQFRKKK